MSVLGLILTFVGASLLVNSKWLIGGGIVAIGIYKLRRNRRSTSRFEQDARRHQVRVPNSPELRYRLRQLYLYRDHVVSQAPSLASTFDELFQAMWQELYLTPDLKSWFRLTKDVKSSLRSIPEASAAPQAEFRSVLERAKSDLQDWQLARQEAQLG